MTDFFIKAESQLFKYRFSCMNKDELLSCVKPLKRLTRKLKSSSCKIEGTELEHAAILLLAIDKQFHWEPLLEDYLDGGREFLFVPYHCVLPLIAKRQVTLNGGIAEVPTSKLCDVMCILSEMLLKSGINLCKDKVNSVMDDERMRPIFRSLKVG